MGRLIACFLFIVIGLYAYKANAETVIHGSSPTGPQPFSANTSGQATITLLSGEDQTNSVFKVEQQFSRCVDDADLACKSAAGFVHTINCYPEDDVAEAGRVRLLDSTSAGAGTEVWGDEFAAAEHTPSGAVLDQAFTTGIFIDFTTTTDVFCVVSYR